MASISSHSTKFTFVLIVLVLVLSFSSLIYGLDSSSSGWNYDCANLTTCNTCSSQNNNTCFWCATNLNNRTEGYCSNFWNITSEELGSCPLWCTGPESECDPCSKGFWPCSESITGQLILVIFYGLLLAYGANMIADGSELLLEIVDPGVIGGLLLPLLGALPDAAIIIVSGATGTSQQAQSQLAIGVGTLAGSTIMLLTIPWSVALWLARCDIRHGESIDNTLTRRYDFKNTGATMDDDIPLNAKIMMGTSISYLIVQAVAFAYLSDPTGATAEKVEGGCALGGLIVCTILLIGYSAFQVLSPKLQEKKINEARNNAILEHTVKHFVEKLRERQLSVGVTTPLISAQESQPVPAPDVRKMGLKWKAAAKEKAATSIQAPESVVPKEEEHDDEETQNADESPRFILIKAVILLGVGTFIVSVFSDPMVDVLADLAINLDIKAFYVSFVITPICSNASETISSLIFAAKKKKKNTALTYSQLYGAATMNNTLCLGIFYALIYFRGLTWEYSAETVAILVVVVAVGVIAATQKTLRLFWALIVATFYPLSLLLVYLLETYAHWQ